MKKYYPILAAKKGELIALQRLRQSVKDEVCPVLQLVPETLQKKVKENNVEKIVYKDDFEKIVLTHWNFFDNQLILDFSLLPEDIYHRVDVRKFIISFLNAGVNVIPALQKNSNPIILKIIKELLSEYNINCCLRTSEHSGGFDDFNNDINHLVESLNVDISKVLLLLDLGYIKNNVNILATTFKIAITSLDKGTNNWKEIIIASGCFPPDLSDLKPQIAPYILNRLESTLWGKAKADFPNIKYGDFGIKNPVFEEVKHAGTVSIRYTTKDHYVIYRGKKTDDHKEGHGQYIIHAFYLTTSPYYSQESFSWGDARIKDISTEDLTKDKRKTGSSTTWVEISQNHHITLLHSIL